MTIRASSMPLARGQRPPALAAPGSAHDVRPRRPAPLLRKVEIACVLPSGEVHEAARLVPALPAFEDAFAALARGTMLPTDRGPVAVEDLWPGLRVRVADGAMRRLLWRGSTMVVPQAPGQDPGMGRLTRIAADALGIARPEHDLVLGPRARVVHRGPAVRALTGREAAFVLASDLADGDGVVSILPAAPVQVFHLGFAAHERLVANGVEVESHHPGPAVGLGLSGDLLDLWLSCFPHMADLAAFGLQALPRLRLHDLDLVDVA